LALALCALAGGTAQAQEGQAQPARDPEAGPPPAAAPAADDVPAQERRTRRLTRERGIRRERSGEPRNRFGGGFGYGRFEINASELGTRDAEDAGVVRLEGEFWPLRHIGFGVTAEMVSTGDDLFEGQQIDSGNGLRPADAEISAHDVSVFFAWDPVAGDRFRLPFQVGPWFNSAFFDYDRARVEYRIGTAGIRFGARPELKLADGDDVDLTVVAGTSYAIGFTSIDEERIGPDETFDSESQQFRAEGGLRLDLRSISLGLHYVYSDNGINLSDVENGRRLPEIDYDTNMFFFTIAGRF
jgi:hypothetical protein